MRATLQASPLPTSAAERAVARCRAWPRIVACRQQGLSTAPAEMRMFPEFLTRAEGVSMIRVRHARPLSSLAALTTGALMMTGATISHASPQDDAKAVAALDTEYQAAVKINDAATMERILADDFVLVTGR